MLKKFLVMALLIAAPLTAQTQQQVDPLAQYLWVARPAIIFADNPLDPRVVQQLAAFEQRADELAERDVVVILDTEPGSALRERFRPRDFQFVIIGKDNQIIYRKPDPVSVRELIRIIDRTPMRQDELRAIRAQRLEDLSNRNAVETPTN